MHFMKFFFYYLYSLICVPLLVLLLFTMVFDVCGVCLFLIFVYFSWWYFVCYYELLLFIFHFRFLKLPQACTYFNVFVIVPNNIPSIKFQKEKTTYLFIYINNIYNLEVKLFTFCLSCCCCWWWCFFSMNTLN